MERRRLRRKRQHGSLLVEAGIAIVLVGIAVTLYVNSTAAGLGDYVWSVRSSIADSAAEYYKAQAERIAFSSIDSAYPTYPASSQSSVTLATYNGKPVTGTLITTKNSYTDPVSGLTGYEIEVHVLYTINDIKYFKTRKVVRMQ